MSEPKDKAPLILVTIAVAGLLIWSRNTPSRPTDAQPLETAMTTETVTGCLAYTVDGALVVRAETGDVRVQGDDLSEHVG